MSVLSAFYRSHALFLELQLKESSTQFKCHKNVMLESQTLLMILKNNIRFTKVGLLLVLLVFINDKMNDINYFHLFKLDYTLVQQCMDLICL